MDSDLNFLDRGGRHITAEMVDRLAVLSGHHPSPDGSVMRALRELIDMYESSGRGSTGCG